MSDPRSVPPGWYPDATNIGYQRYWDGTAWTPHVTRIDAQQQPRPATAGWGRRIVVAILVVVVITAGVAVAVRRHHSSVRRAAAPSSSLALARIVSVAPGDLPAGWTECCRAQVLSPVELRQHVCGSAPGLADHLAGYARQYSLNLRSNDLEDGHLVSTVVVGQDAASASREFAGVNSRGYQACVIPDLESAELATRTVVGRPTTTVVRSTLDVGAPAILDRYVTRYRTTSATAVTFAAVVRFVVGRVLVRLDFQTYASPIIDSTISSIARATADRAQHEQNLVPKTGTTTPTTVSAQRPPLPADGRRYDDNTHGFTVWTAPSWEVSTLATTPDGVAWDIGGRDPYTETPYVFSVSVLHLPQRMTLDQFADQEKSAFDKGKAGAAQVASLRLNSDQRVRLANGSLGVLFDTQTTYSGSVNMRTLELFTIKGHTEVAAEFQTSVQDFARATAAVEPYMLTLEVH